jgi:uncharacterized protein
MDNHFKPAWWLNSPHLQTIWPTLMRPRRRLEVEWQRIDLRDGDFIDLAWFRRDGPLVMLIHGLEGSLESHYAVPMLERLNLAGFNTVFMHLRGCGRAPNRLNRSYHSGASEDLAEVIQALHRQGERPEAVVGFSLGGNLLLKYLGETGSAAGLQAAVAVSVPFRLDIAARHLQQGAARIYGKYLLNKLLASYRQKFSGRLDPLGVKLSSIDSIYSFDQMITAPLNGFASADDYYHRCSCIGFLRDIMIPTLILHATDDPLMTPEVIPERSQLGPGITLEITPHGGHVGFVNGSLPWRPGYWVEQRIPDFLRQQLLLKLGD